MVEISFCVKGHPPKKISEKSMWSIDNQAPLIIELRKQALKARNRSGLDEPIKTKLSLELKLFGPELELEEIGDLDNLLSGVCDVLQPKPNNPELVPSEIFNSPEYEDVSPEKAILFENDSNIYKLYAEKRTSEYEKYYAVTVKPIELSDPDANKKTTDPFIEDIQYWAAKYDEDHPWWTSEEKRIGDKIREDKEFGMETLKEIVEWKFKTVPGRIVRIKNLLKNHTDKEVKEITGTVLPLPKSEDRNKVHGLCELKGVGPALASTILTFHDPQDYCVYDIHILREVYGEEPKHPFNKYTGCRHYIRLLEYIRLESSRLDLPARTIEKALFKKNMSRN